MLLSSLGMWHVRYHCSMMYAATVQHNAVERHSTQQPYSFPIAALATQRAQVLSSSVRAQSLGVPSSAVEFM